MLRTSAAVIAIYAFVLASCLAAAECPPSTDKCFETVPDAVLDCVDVPIVCGRSSLQPVDIVFALDGTEAIEEPDAVKSSLEAFIGEMGVKYSEYEFSVRYAAVVFGGQPELALQFTVDADSALEFVQGYNPGEESDVHGDHTEGPVAVLEAVRMVIGTAPSSFDNIHWREHARKHVVIVTGEDSDAAFHSENRFGEQEEEVDEIDDDYLAEIVATAKEVADSGASLTFVIGQGGFFDSVITEQLGDPAFNVAYKDGRNFKEGPTRRLLEENQLSTCFQAVAISYGASVRLFDIANVEMPEVWQHLGPPRLFPAFGDMCTQDECNPTEGCVVRDITCSDGQTCTPSMGCGSDVTQGADAQRSNSDDGHGADDGDDDTPHIYTAAPGRIPLFNPKPTPKPVSGQRYTQQLIKSEVNRITVDPDTTFVPRIVAGGVPVVVKNSVATSWPAAELWSFDYLHKEGDKKFINTKTGTDPYMFFDSDTDQALAGEWATNHGIDLGLPYAVRNLSGDVFWHHITNPQEGRAWYHFCEVPEDLEHDVKPDAKVYASLADAGRAQQYMFISSRGPNMHTHFDQDHNVFIQMIGTKRFTLFPPHFHEDMYMFPRLHPLWHKAQPAYDAPDLAQFPRYSEVTAYTANLEPGDVLYVPPYWWHHVESLSNSVSLTTWSRKISVTESMNAAYAHDLVADSLTDPAEKAAALQIFLETLIEEVQGTGRGKSFMRSLLESRYGVVREIWRTVDESVSCPSPVDWENAPDWASVAYEDGRTVAKHTSPLNPSPEILDIVLMDYIEEVANSVVGVENVYPFLYKCVSQ